MGEGFKRAYRIFTSRKTAIGLFGIISVISLVGTFIEKRGFYSNPMFVALLGLLGLSLLLCTAQRFNTLSKPVLILHLGVIVTFMGGIISSFGFVATVNIYEGSTVDTVYRWDIEDDAPLGVALTLNKIEREYYPVPVKVGVLKGEEKVGLFEIKTGESFDIGDNRVRADDLDVISESLKLSVFNQGHFIGYAETSERHELPSGFPYTFVLVAYKNPYLKRVWVDLTLTNGAEILAEGTSEVNSPFEWQGLWFHHTKVDLDLYGNPYAGIQITKDPGRPVVYAGFIIICLGGLLYLIRRLYGLR